MTGILRFRKLASDPVMNSKGEISTGLEGESYVLENPTWSVSDSLIMPTLMKPPTTRFIPALTIKPTIQLLSWLNEQGNTSAGLRKRLLLPVVIRFEDSHRLAISDAFIGVIDANTDKDTLFLSLDDTGMGISLLMKLRGICPKSATSCVVWLEGYWGSLVELDGAEPPAPKKEEGIKWPFSVLQVHQFVAKQTELGEAVTVFIEHSSL